MSRLNNSKRSMYTMVFQNVSRINKLLLLSIIAFFSGLLLVGEVVAAPGITDWFNNITQNNATAFTANETDSIFFNVTVNESVNYSWYRNGSIVGSNQNNWTWNTDSSTDGDWNITVVVNNSNGEDSSEWNVTIKEEIQVLIDAVPWTGGNRVVTLEDRTYNLSTVVYINRSDFILKGSHDTVVNTDMSNLGGNVGGMLMIPGGGQYGYEGNHVNITIKNINMSRPSQVACSGSSAMIMNYNASNVTIENIWAEDTSFCKFYGTNDNQNTSLKARYMWVQNNTVRGSIVVLLAEDVWIEDNYVHDCSPISNGIDSNRNINDIMIRNNVIKNCGVNGGIKIYAGTRLNVYNNTINDCLNICLQAQSTPQNSTIQNNTMWGASVAGIDIYTTGAIKNLTFKNNIIYNNSGYGVYTRRRGNPADQDAGSYIYLENNVIFNNSDDGIRLDNANMTVYIKNNIIANNSGYGINNVADNQSVVSYNCFYGNINGIYNNIAPGTGNINDTDPLFANASNYDFHLKSTAGRWNGTDWVNDTEDSSAIDAGDLNDDYSNEPLLNGKRINLGAYGNTIYASRSTKDEAIPPEISFVDPTPSNGASLPSSTSSVTINISIIEEHNDTLIFNWNGAEEYNGDYNTGVLNFTMAVSAGNSYTFYVWANDTRDNNQTTETRSFSVQSSYTPPSSGGGGGGGAADPVITTTTEKGKVQIVIDQLPANTDTTVTIPATENMPLSSLTINPKAKVVNVEINVTTLDDKPSDISQDPSGKVGDYIQIDTKNIPDSDLNNVTNGFKVPVSWINDNKIDKATVVLNRHADGKWAALTTTKTSEDDDYVYYSATSPGLSVFGISGQVVKAPETTAPPVTTAPPTVAPTTTPPPTAPPTTAPPVEEAKLPVGKIALAILAILAIAIIAGAAYYFYRSKVGGEGEGKAEEYSNEKT